MKVYLGYECYDDCCNIWRRVVKVFDDEVLALCWKEDFQPTETEWRDYGEFTVERVSNE
jgi:hypothetical protein